MSVSRANLIVGPARVVRGTGISSTARNGSCYTRDAIKVDIVKEQVEIHTEAHGHVDYRDEDVLVKMTFSPAEWTANSRSLLWPYLTPEPGFAIFGATDTATTIHDYNSHLHTIVASAVTKMPSLRLSVREAMIGQCEITGVRKLASDWSTANSLYTVATTGGSFIDDTVTPFTIAGLKQEQYTGLFTGITGLTAIQTMDGWTVDFDTKISFQKIEESGTVKGTLVSTMVMAKCTPLAVSHANLMAALRVDNSGFKRGQSAAATGADLVITGASTGPVITLKNCDMKQAGYHFGASVLRDGEVGFVSTVPFASSVAGAICTLA